MKTVRRLPIGAPVCVMLAGVRLIDGVITYVSPTGRTIHISGDPTPYTLRSHGLWVQVGAAAAAGPYLKPRGGENVAQYYRKRRLALIAFQATSTRREK